MNAKIIMTCDNAYRAHANNRYIGSSLSWKHAREHNFPLIDGDNEILIQCVNHGGPAGLLATIEYEGETIVTDSSWEVSADREHWFPAHVIGEYGIHPWGKRISNITGTPNWIWDESKSRKMIWVRKQFTYSAPITIDVETTKTLSPEAELLQKFEAFITPDHPAVIAKVNELDRDPVKCYRFVASQIQYVTDERNYGESEHWCYPHETLSKMSGDCEDQAFLIASMFLHLGIPAFVRTAYLLQYGGGHAWCYFRWENQWLPAECTNDAFDPWDANKRPSYGAYLPYVDIRRGSSHNYTGLEIIKHALRIKAGNYTDGTMKLARKF